MLNNDFITTLLNLSNVLVDKVENSNNLIKIYLYTEKSEQVCPCCGHKTSRVHDYRMQNIKDLPITKKKTLLVLKKRRYVCPHCGKRFAEHYDFIPRYQHMTPRMFASIIDSIAKKNTYKQTSKEHFVSSHTVIKALNMVEFSNFPALPEVLGIDEYKGNANGEKYQVQLTDLQHNKTLNLLPTRRKLYLINYFEQYSIEERRKVKYLVADMWKDYRSLKWLFPNASVVVDRFHYVRQVYWALDRVRKRVQKEFCKNKRIHFKHSRYLMFKNYEDLKMEQQVELQYMLSQNQDLSDAWHLKELFNKVRLIKDYDKGKVALREWIERAKNYELEEFKDCIKSFKNWFNYIVESFRVPYTNAYTEGKHNFIKALKRNGFGYPNFSNFRKIALLCA